MSTLFERQLAIYSTYHRDERNRITHFIGIPAIVLSLMPPLALWQIGSIDGAWVVGALAALGWIVLDRTIGIAMTLVLIVMILIAEWIVTAGGAPAAWWTFAVLFVGGWVFQIVGHVYEGRRPALLDNLFQAFIGPMFIMAEALVALGLRRDLANVIHAAPLPH